MKGVVVTVGNEILCGDIVNKDLAIIAEESKKFGITIEREITVKDNIQAIVDALNGGKDYEIVFVTGGLGPTRDDVTRKALAIFLNEELIFNAKLHESIEKRVKEWGLPDNPLHKNYAFYPEKCKTVENPAGLAPGLICQKNNTTIIVLPGPPRELEPTLLNAFNSLKLIPTERGIVKIYRTFGTREVNLQDIIQKIDPEGRIEVGYYPSIYGVKLKLRYNNEEELYRIEPLLKQKLGKDLYSDNDEELPEVFGKIMKGKNLTVATAESCTGGLIGHLITQVSGSSAYFIGGIIAYSNDVKANILGCSRDTLEKYGAVSEQIARQMAEGVRNLLKTYIGISTTGIAGPTGGTPQKPVGLVYIGFTDGKTTKVIKKNFKGSREEIKKQAALWALDLARRMLI